MLLLLLFFTINASSVAISNNCEYIVQHPVTKIFHLANSSCFAHVKNDINSFCTRLKGFDKPILIISELPNFEIQCVAITKYSQFQAIFKHCRTPTGIVVKQGQSEAYNEQGDSTHCYQIYYYNKTEPLIEFNNRESCMHHDKVYELLKVGQKSSDGEVECRGNGKFEARPSFTVVNGTLYTCYEEHFDNIVFDAFDCYEGSSLIPAKDQFMKSDGILWYRCKPANISDLRFSYAKEQFLGCVSRKIVDPISTPFIYKNGEFMKEYGQKCSPDLKVKATGQKKFCTLNGLQYEMGTWLRVLVSSSHGHFYYCENDKGKPKASYSILSEQVQNLQNVFQGCFTKTTKSLVVTMINVTGNGMDKPMQKCVGKTTEYDLDKTLFEYARRFD